MKILIDMNLSPRWAEALGPYNIVAVHWSAVGTANASDTEIIEYARIHGYTILTHDLDFSAILAANRRNKPSVIQLRTGNIDTFSTRAVSRIPEALVAMFIICSFMPGFQPLYVYSNIKDFPGQSLSPQRYLHTILA